METRQWMTIPVDEFESLHARLRESEAENDQWQKKLTEVWAERERLRAEVADWHHVADLRSAEIERLRAVLDKKYFLSEIESRPDATADTN